MNVEEKDTLKIAAGTIVACVGLIIFAFSVNYDKAIDDKIAAEQRALKAQDDLERVKSECEQRIAQSKAEADAIRVQAEAVQKQSGQEYVQLKFIEKWDGKLPVYGEVLTVMKQVQ